MNEADIAIRFVAEDATKDEIQAAVDEQLDAIEKYIGYQALQLDPFNSTIRDTARQLLTARKERILKARQTVASLGYPLTRRDGAPATYISPVVRKKLPVRMTPVEGFQPEPEMHENDYQSILKIIENMTWVMERTPSAFVKMPEEVLRDHYLVQLNGQYESATSETFNASGATDILVSDHGRNIFIAECKIWVGPQSASDALDQLLGYLTWRDTKAALMIFSRNKDFSAVLGKLWEAVEAHPQFKRGPQKISDTRQRYVFTRADDPLREIHLTVMAFNIPN